MKTKNWKETNDMVEWKRLGEICDVLDFQRKPVSKGKRSHGIYPYYGANGIQDYVDKYIFDGTFLLLGEDGSVINKDNSPVLHWATGKIWVNNHAHILKENENALLRYLYYCLQCIDVSDIVRGMPPKINQANMRNIPIPVPPIAEQHRIVNILDAFTAAIDNLKQQIEQRRKQYEYYRDQLLDLEGKDGVEMKKLGDVLVSLKTGLNPRKNFVLNSPGSKNFYITVRELGHYNITPTDKTDMVTDEALKLINNRSNLEKGDVLFSGTGTIGRTALVKEKPNNWNIKEGVYTLKPIQSVISSKFLIELLHTNPIMDKINSFIVGDPIRSVPMKSLVLVSIPVPSLEEQSHIVGILDTFEASIANLEQQLEMREKQYEYYRNKLLDFE